MDIPQGILLNTKTGHHGMTGYELKAQAHGDGLFGTTPKILDRPVGRESCNALKAFLRGQNKQNSGIPETGTMETVKLGKKGQMSIPKGILKRLGLEDEVTLLVDTTPEDQSPCVQRRFTQSRSIAISASGSSTRLTARMRRRRLGSRGSSSASEAAGLS
jgi:bifunctional DNA-binding transcriptional regulator/antitoxin component of YhaV-PrlF toxin-antitoxin module